MRYVGRVRHKERVTRSGRELPDDTYVVERHEVVRVVVGELQAQPDQAAGLKLIIAYGFVGDKHSIGARSQRGEHGSGVAAGEKCVRNGGALLDRARVDPEHVLEII